MTMSIKDAKNAKRRAAYKAASKINKGDIERIESQHQIIIDQARQIAEFERVIKANKAIMAATAAKNSNQMGIIREWKEKNKKQQDIIRKMREAK